MSWLLQTCGVEAVDVDHLEVGVPRHSDEELVAEQLRLELLRERLRLQLELVRLVSEDPKLLDFRRRPQELRSRSEVDVGRKPDLR